MNYSAAYRPKGQGQGQGQGQTPAGTAASAPQAAVLGANTGVERRLS